MKNFILASILLIGNAAFGQSKECSSLWLGSAPDSIEVIRKTAEEFLQTQLKMANNEGIRTIYEMNDNEGVSLLKVWMKGKKTIAGGTVTTTYSVNSYKITGVDERIQSLFNSFKEKVAPCTTTSSDLSIVFATGKITVEKQGGDISKKNIPLWTMTVAPTR
jgi:hypothetical protein